MRVERWSLESAIAATAFLKHYEDTCQFLIGNLLQYGHILIEHPNSGNYYVIVDDASEIHGVFCLPRRGNVLSQTDYKEDYSDLILDTLAQEPIKITGSIGDWRIAEPLWRGIRKRYPHIHDEFVSKEILYSLDAKDFPREKSPQVRFLKDTDFTQWAPMRLAFIEESGMRNDLSNEELHRLFVANCVDKRWWGYFEGEKLVSMAALNSSSKEVGQVGGVYTLPPFRSLGLSKITMRHLLSDCKDIHSHRKSILFTDEKNLPAQKVYESLGYRRIGFYGIFFAK